MRIATTTVVSSLCVFALTASFAAPAAAQTAEPKERAPMYTYEANWVYPRALWPDVEKGAEANRKILEKAMAGGGLVGFGGDAAVIHSAEGATHDNWFSGVSQASVLNVLDEVAKANSGGPSLMPSSTKHWDNLYVSRYYNWKAGSWKGAYTRAAAYTLKADAPNDAVEMMAKSFIVPVMEKLLADGAIVEYEIDQEAVHTVDPSEFYVVFITPTAEGLDKVTAALGEAMHKSPLTGPALGSFADMAKHRDGLLRSTATYK